MTVDTYHHLIKIAETYTAVHSIMQTYVYTDLYEVPLPSGQMPEGADQLMSCTGGLFASTLHT